VLFGPCEAGRNVLRENGHILEHPVHNRNELPELISINDGILRLLEVRQLSTSEIRQLTSQRVLLGLLLNSSAAGCKAGRARDQYLVRSDSPVDRYGESDLALKFSVSCDVWMFSQRSCLRLHRTPSAEDSLCLISYRISSPAFGRLIISLLTASFILLALLKSVWVDRVGHRVSCKITPVSGAHGIA